MNMSTLFGLKRVRWAGGLVVFSLLATTAIAQAPAPRITTEIDNSERAVLPHTHPPLARSENEHGRVPGGTTLHGMNLVFSRTAAQEADLAALIAAQQNRASSLYHQWLTPEEFAARFGVADADLSAVEAWLNQQGFTVDGVSRSRNRITFSGAVQQVESAFGTEMHYYLSNGETHYAPADDLSVPAALAPVVKTVRNLSDFRPKPRVRLRAPQLAKPLFTSGQTGSHFLTPKDVATIYDINAAYSAGYTGAGQTIAVVGQSAIAATDITNFQSAAGLATKAPNVTLVSGSGTSTFYTGDESESDLDLEYAGGIAPGATIDFVYVGSSQNYSVWDSVSYAVDNKIAPIISMTYGACEASMTASDYSTLEGLLAQAAAQGQSVIAAAGDNGSTDCYGETTLSTTVQESLAVDYPGSSEYVTSMGGTEFTSAAVAASNTTYWQSASGSDVISSALSYMPEQVWNDDSSSIGLSSGGGGVSSLTSRPTWQTGVPGIPSGSMRLVPDISLAASPENAPYLYCSSDTTSTKITGSCSNGFRDSSNQYLTVAGGTSFAAPVFAGMLAIINQKLGSSGQGVVNPTLYTLAANAEIYASAFHDTTSGGNECNAGASYCSSTGSSVYLATTGYDEASGLGSVDLYNLMMAWSSASSTLVPSTTTLSPATATPSSGASDNITITVASTSTSETATPTGTVSVAVDGTTVNSALGLTSGAASYTFSSTTPGTHVIAANYSGDSNYAPSSGSVSVTITGSKAFSLAATNVTISAGSAGSSTVTITPQYGYTGTVKWTVSSSPTLTYGCVAISNAAVSGTSAVTATMNIYTRSSSCSSSSVIGTGGHSRERLGPGAFWTALRPFGAKGATGAASALAALLLLGLLVYRPRRLRLLVGVPLLALVCFAASCGGGSSTSTTTTTTNNTPAGTYTLTIVGTDTSTSSITASTKMTLTVD
jgi:subtilase family serine protease